MRMREKPESLRILSHDLQCSHVHEIKGIYSIFPETFRIKHLNKSWFLISYITFVIQKVLPMLGIDFQIQMNDKRF